MMTIGIVGRKCGMTRLFTDDGLSIPVTVVEASPNHVTSLLTEEDKGYNAIQISWGTKKSNTLRKTEAGNYTKANIDAGEGLLEYRVTPEELGQHSIGGMIKVDIFETGQKVDVTGTSKGKGFAGAIKRHNFARQDATHGNKHTERAPGSIGQASWPSRVFKGMRMAGRMGSDNVTVKNLEIVGIDKENNLLFIKGAIPGANNTPVFLLKK